MKRSCLILASVGLLFSLGLGVLSAASNEHRPSTPEQVFDGMRKSFDFEKARGVNARYQFNLSGPTGGEWFVNVNDGKFEMSRGRIDHPDVTLVTSDKDWVALSNGDLSGTWAFLTGRLKIRGDRGLAKKLGEIFP
jgi:putative sterol carrier protein